MRLRQLSEEFPGQFDIEHRSFVLRGDINPNATFSDYHLMHRKRAREMTGLKYDLPTVGSKYPSSSFPALAAAKYVERHHPEQFDAFDLALFEAFFQRSFDISSPEVLSNIAISCGIKGEKVTEAIADQTYIDMVLADYESAHRLGISGVPAVIIGREVITGAVPYEQYKAALQAVRTSS